MRAALRKHGAGEDGTPLEGGFAPAESCTRGAPLCFYSLHTSRSHSTRERWGQCVTVRGTHTTYISGPRLGALSSPPSHTPVHALPSQLSHISRTRQLRHISRWQPHLSPLEMVAALKSALGASSSRMGHRIARKQSAYQTDL